MANESLARIMYGTSDEARSDANVPHSDGLANESDTQTGSAVAVATEETLGELLHRAWLNVSGKH